MDVLPADAFEPIPELPQMKTPGRFPSHHGRHPAKTLGRIRFCVLRARSCSNVLLCLFALVAQIVVPIAHRYFLDVEETARNAMISAGHPCRTGDSPNGSSAWGERRKAPSSRSSHDAESCAICQVLLHASSFVGTGPQELAHALPIANLLNSDHSGFDLARFIPEESIPRAPPSSIQS